MRVQFEQTDTFNGEANYGWVKREQLVLPDGMPDAIVVKLARLWAGWFSAHSRWSKMGGNDDIQLLPTDGTCQIVFITFDNDTPDHETTKKDVILWADGIVAALGTEYANRVSESERRLAELILRVEGTLAAPPGSRYHGGDTPDDTPTVQNCDDAGTGEGRFHGRM